MDHVAIMKKSWGLTEKIVEGKKTIESRWYKSKYAPWGRIKPGEAVYFKNSGESVSIKTKVKKILCFSDLNPRKVKSLLNKYAKADGIEKDKIPVFFNLFKNKKYCMLIFLKDAKRIKPFDIDKTGFGAMAAWICVKNINQIKR